MTMTTDTAVMLALATGAAARMEPNAFARERPAVATYQELVALLERAYPAIDGRMMEIAPGSRERQELLAGQIRQSQAANDAAVLQQSRRVLQAILAGVPQATMAIFAEDAAATQAVAAIEHDLEEKQNGTRSHARHPGHPTGTAPPAHLPAV
jgi:hypothetical protein